MQEIKGKYTTAKIYTNNLEVAASQQIRNMVSHPAFTNPIAVMPDVHAGMGSVIGFTMPLSDRVIPNVVGVDIGCGMLAVKIKRPLNIKLDILDRDIRKRIPFGMNVRGKSDGSFGFKKNDPQFIKIEKSLIEMWKLLKRNSLQNIKKFPDINYLWYQKKCEQIGMDFNRAQMSIGTLGGGNHFIELGISSEKNNLLWIIIHSGSRQLGKTICEFHQKKAKKIQERATKGNYQDKLNKIKREFHKDIIQKKITDFRAEYGIASGVNNKGLESLVGDDKYNYLYDMAFTQLYASYNRQIMMEEVLSIIFPKRETENLLSNEGKTPVIESVETVHNFISTRDLIIRKGSVESYKGQKIVIPFNMKDGTWICLGKGEPSWNFSAPHGAGRRMSRSKAKNLLNIKDAEKQMKGIYTSCIPLDEVPAAYKPAKEIKSEIYPTAEVIEEIKPIINLKAKS